MKGLHATLAGDLRSVGHFLIPLGMLHVLRLGSLLGWFGTPEPDIESNVYGPPMVPLMVSLATTALTMFVVVVLMVQTSPSRAGGHFATRPVRPSARVLSGVLALGIVLWVPFVLTDVIALAVLGEPMRVAFPAVADTALVHAVWIVCVLPALWMWRSGREIWVGSIMAVLAVGLSALTVWGWFEMTRIGHEGAFFNSAMTRARLLAVFIVAGVLGWLLLLREWNGGWWSPVRRVGGVAGIAALTAAGLFFWPRGDSGPAREVSLEGAEVRATRRDDGGVHLSMVIPTTTVEGNEDRVMRIAGASLDGEKLPIWDRPVGPSWFAMGHTLSPALAGRIASELDSEAVLLADVAEPAAHKVFHSRDLPDVAWPEGEERKVSLGLDGRAFHWERVASMPVEPGARDGAWTLVEIGEGGPNEWRLSLLFRSVRGFLKEWPEKRSLGFVLVGGEAERAEVSSGAYPVASISGGSLSLQGYWADFQSRGDKGKPSGGERLLIYRLVPGERLAGSWRGRATMEGVARAGRGLARRQRDREPADVTDWMRQEAPPAVDADGSEVRRYLATLLSQLNDVDGHLSEGHPAVEWMSGLAAGRENGVELLLRGRGALAMDDHTERRAIDAALAEGFRREDLPRLVGIDAVLVAAGERRWLEDVESELVAGAKEGRYEPLERLMELPNRGGMSHEELFELFLRYPRPDWYRLLGRDAALKRAMDRRIREWWESMAPSVDPLGGEPGFPVELALAAGFPEAPERLHRLAGAVGSFALHGGIDSLVARYFDTDGWLDHSGGWHADEFLTRDPSRFEFDPARGKYVWKGDSE